MYSDFFAIILARGGSKTIPNKNIKKIHNTNCLELTIKSYRKEIQNGSIRR